MYQGLIHTKIEHTNIGNILKALSDANHDDTGAYTNNTNTRRILSFSSTIVSSAHRAASISCLLDFVLLLFLW